MASKVDQYFSSDEESDLPEVELIPKRRKKSKEWLFEKKFANPDEAKLWLDVEKIWGHDFKNQTEDGEKVFYRCNLVKSRGEQCAASIHLLYDACSDDVLLFRTDSEHTHESIETKRSASISPSTEEEIRRLYSVATKPKAIRLSLAKNDFPVPTMTQLKNFLSKLSKEKFGASSMSLGELEKWLKENSVIPEDEDIAFVVDYQVSYDDELSFRFFMSTKRLLETAKDSEIVHADATYKLIWQGYPVLVVGTSDSDRHFHNFGIAVCMAEKTEDFVFLFKALLKGVNLSCNSEMAPKVLVSDAAESIQNAFKEVFGDHKEIVMCWAHTQRNISKKLNQWSRRKILQLSCLTFTIFKQFQVQNCFTMQWIYFWTNGRKMRLGS